MRVDAASVEQLSTVLLELVESEEALTLLVAEAMRRSSKRGGVRGRGRKRGQMNGGLFLIKSSPRAHRRKISTRLCPILLGALYCRSVSQPTIVFAGWRSRFGIYLRLSLSTVQTLRCGVDNASTDDTPAVVEPYLSRQDFAYHRNPQNVGMLVTVLPHTMLK